MINHKHKKILLVEDDIDLGNVLNQYLEMNSFKVCLVRNGVDAYEEFKCTDFDLCIIDVMMPKMDGFTLAEKIIKEKSEIPFIFLTAKTLKEDKHRGLKIGADDYITKPFDPEELVLRIKNILKRSGKDSSEIYHIGNYQLDIKNLRLTLNDKNQLLTEKEAELLKMFIQNKNVVIKRSEILSSIWGENDYFLGRSMDVFVSRLRKYLSADKRIKINTIRGVGFILELT